MQCSCCCWDNDESCGASSAQIAYGWSPEELHLNHRYLTMSQIHSALAYYWDHKAEPDMHINQREQHVKQAEQEAGESPFVRRLRAQGL